MHNNFHVSDLTIGAEQTFYKVKKEQTKHNNTLLYNWTRTCRGEVWAEHTNVGCYGHVTHHVICYWLDVIVVDSRSASLASFSTSASGGVNATLKNTLSSDKELFFFCNDYTCSRSSVHLLVWIFASHSCSLPKRALYYCVESHHHRKHFFNFVATIVL